MYPSFTSQLNELRADMSKTYSTARVCRDTDKTRCHPLDPGKYPKIGPVINTFLYIPLNAFL